VIPDTGQTTNNTHASRSLHNFQGSVVEIKSDAIVISRRTQYTSQPFKKWYLMEIENNELAAAGPTARMTETIICARPFVEPREALFGADEVTKMKAQPLNMNRN